MAAKKPMRMLTVEDIVAANTLAEEIVEISDWDGSFRIREWTKKQEIEMRRAARGEDGKLINDRLEMLMIVTAVVDPPLTEEHIPLLEAKSGRIITELLRRIIVLTGQSKEERDRAEAEFPPE